MEIRINIEIEKWPITRLIPRITNPRTHTPEQIAQIAASMREWGWTNPTWSVPNNDVSARHARLLAARGLAMEEVPVTRPSRLPWRSAIAGGETGDHHAAH
jgi:ParB-like chromosome segregation protein Spo0J